MPKIIEFDEQARRVLEERGMNQLAHAVRVTLGPRLQRGARQEVGSADHHQRHGRLIAKEIELEDPYENIGLSWSRGRQEDARTSRSAPPPPCSPGPWWLVGLRNVAAGANPMSHRGRRRGGR